jgi:hypothetical protein
LSTPSHAHDLRETKNEISELKSVIKQLAQKLATTTLGGNYKEAVKNKMSNSDLVNAQISLLYKVAPLKDKRT